MLSLQKKPRYHIKFFLVGGLTVSLLGSGLYILSLVSAPIILPYVSASTIDPASLESPRSSDDRIIIPKIGVDIPYGYGKAALDAGAEWRYPERGNPASGGNFIIAAHRFQIAITPQATLAKSPFYHVDKLENGDQIIVDREGSRYGYEVTKVYNVTPDQVEIEAPSKEAKMTLYTCSLGGSADGRVVIEAKPLGEVTVENSQT